MIAIICVDNSLGMTFNNRRQSRDERLNERILSLSGNSKLLMNGYSFRLFEKYQKSNIKVDENFLEIASEGEYCFVENQKLFPYAEKIEKLILYKWNRDYPADFYLDININELKLEKICEFEGNSHERITEEIYTK